MVTDVMNEARGVELANRDWRLIVGGKRVASRSGKTFKNYSPVIEDNVCELPDGGAEDVAAAVEVGKRAIDKWNQQAPRVRGRYLRELASVLRAHKEELAALDAIDVGNAYTPMLGDVEVGADSLEFMADSAGVLSGEVYNDTTTHLHYTIREPFGVVARIVAFNHPLMFAIQKLGAPLVAGNAVILKPSDFSSLSALRIGELASEVMPEGLVSVLVGKGADLPRSIVRHPDIRRIGFIGSEPTGRAIQREAADVAVKDVSLELGGKNAIIVCNDVDVKAAARGVVKGMNFIGWQSQSCSSTSRLIVHKDIARELMAEVVKVIEEIRIGHPLHAKTQMGTMANLAQFEKTQRYIEKTREAGAEIATGGGRPAGVPTKGLYIEPTVFVNVPRTSAIAFEEVFGPVLSTFEWSDESDVISLANSVQYGLTGSIWTRDVVRAHRFAQQLHAGYIWINDASSHFNGLPFGGYKSSGIGKEESKEEVLSYSQMKSVHLALNI